MKKVLMLLTAIFVLGGCEGFRYPATEAQKENAWLHLRTTQLTREQASSEAASETLQSLAALACEQSGAFVADYGVPRELPESADADVILSTAGVIAAQAGADGARQIDPWAAADSLLELGIGIAGLLGGVYGLKAAGFLKQAREKAQALKEIIRGNELFKQLHADSAKAFKEAQKNQSPATRKLVTELKSDG